MVTAKNLLDLASSAPTVYFTGLLVFGLLWLVLSVIFGGDGGDSGTDDGSLDFLNPGGLPTAAGVVFIALPAWAVSMIGQWLIRSELIINASRLVNLIVIAAVAFVAGFTVLQIARRKLGDGLKPNVAPSRNQTIGALAKVRIAADPTGETDTPVGDALVISGPTIGSLIRIESDEPCRVGDIVVAYDFDDRTGRFLVTRIDKELTDELSANGK